MEWIGLGVLIFIGLMIFAPDVLLIPVGYAFAGMMEPTKSRRLLSHGIALALFGPLLIGGLLLHSWLLAWLGLRWLAGGGMVAAAILFLAWVIAGVVLGFVKSRHKIDEQRITASQHEGKYTTMELILTLIGEFVIAPMLSFVVQVFQFLFWMCYWVIYTIVCCLSAAKRSIRSMVTSQMSSTIPGKHPTADKP